MSQSSRKILSEHSVSITNPRILVLEALLDFGNPITIDELQLKLGGSVAKSTLYRVLNDLKKITKHLNSEESSIDYKSEEKNTLEKLYNNSSNSSDLIEINKKKMDFKNHELSDDKYHFAEEIKEEETLSIHDKELELIKKALERNNGKRKAAAIELGISERTLYRKIKQHDIEL